MRVQKALEELKGYIENAMGIWIENIKVFENGLHVQGKSSKSIDDIIAILQEVGLEFPSSCQIEKRM